MYRFEVNFWDEDIQQHGLEKGIAAGATYSEAIDRVVEYYGKSNIIDIKIYELDTILIDENFSNL